MKEFVPLPKGGCKIHAAIKDRFSCQDGDIKMYCSKEIWDRNSVPASACKRKSFNGCSAVLGVGADMASNFGWKGFKSRHPGEFSRHTFY